MRSRDEIRVVAPALEKSAQDRLLGEVWKRPGLVPRDRSIVYRRYGGRHVDPMVASAARAATIELAPR
jgi:hypothetical protein